MPEPQFFADSSSLNADPVGVAASIYLAERGDTQIFRLDFPGIERLSLEVREGSAKAFIGGDAAVRAGYTIGLTAVKLGTQSAQFQEQGSRVQLRHHDEVIWTWRPAWKDSEERAKICGQVFVERPEHWGEDLRWWLLASLVTHQREMSSVAPEAVAANYFHGVITFSSPMA